MKFSVLLKIISVPGLAYISGGVDAPRVHHFSCFRGKKRVLGFINI